jgi:RimJ/RimL family protein N-acetyltransferase
LKRLSIDRLTPGDLAEFHRLVTDSHIRRFLLDGAVMDEEWSRLEIERSDALFESTGLGLWLLRENDERIGFAGYRVFEEMSPEPQLIFALLEQATGRGLATEAGRAMIERAAPTLGSILAAVDEPNIASVRVLEKLGFRPDGSVPGAFGRTLLFRTEPRSHRGVASDGCAATCDAGLRNRSRRR